MIKKLRCKITGRLVKMYYTGDLESEYGANGHKGWLCLHRGYYRKEKQNGKNDRNKYKSKL